MTNKEWLMQGLALKREISELRERYRNNVRATSRIELLENMDRKQRVIDEITDSINKVEDPMVRTILLARYVNGKTIEQIADEQFYSITHIGRILRKGEQEIKRS